MAIHKLLLALVLTSVTSVAFASGSYGGGRTQAPPPRPVDTVYEHGKAVFNGKLADYGKIRFCVSAPGASSGARVNRKALKPFVGGSASDLASNLHNCDDPGQQIVDTLAQNDLTALLHYLNKRYNLGLQG